MVILVPADGVGLDEMEDETVSTGISGIVAETAETELIVQLPKFEFQNRVRLRQHLEALGMVDAFQSGVADFSAMSPNAGEIHLDAVVHEAYVKVDEEGTEAAAATGVELSAVSAPFEFVVNRPFLFVIRDKLTGALLFIGRVLDPRA